MPVVDDGSVADVLLTVRSDRGGIVAISAVTGTRRWDSGAMPRGDALVLDGRIIVMAGRQLAAVDARGGHELWSAPLPEGVNYLVAVEGRLLAVTNRDLIALG